jgi:hypothetical protein
MARKRKKRSDLEKSVNGLKDSDVHTSYTDDEGKDWPALECTKRRYDEKLGAWDYFVDWNGEDLAGQTVLINGVKRRVKFCNFYDEATVLTVSEEDQDAGKDG